VRRLVAALALVAGCAELGVVGDGTSISIGRPSRGRIIDGVRIPASGEGFFTREIWATRGQRYGTEELVDLLVSVSRRVAATSGGTRLVVADLSGKGGGPAYAWHRSHQSGRDVDLLYYMRDADGKPMEADAMRVFGRSGVARDGSGITIDIPRTWLLVKELLTAPEAVVQWVFMYDPIAAKLLEHAESTGEPEWLIERARKAVKQPGDSARHDDHMHVRVYCSPADRMYGCVDGGPMELLAEREAELESEREAGAGAELAVGPGAGPGALGMPPASGGASPPAAGGAGGASPPTPSLRSLGRALRAGPHRIDLRRWR